MSSKFQFSSRLFPVEAGQAVTVFGKTKVNAEAFVVKLTNARDIEDISDVHFNFSVNFKTKEVVRNSFLVGVGWGKEEKSENLLTGGELNTIKMGHTFKIDIEVYEKLLLVFVDNRPFCSFALRKPLHEIQKVVVSGDVEKVFGIDHLKIISDTFQPNENQAWRGLIPNAFKPVNLIVVAAVPGDEAGSFKFNFRETLKCPILLQLTIIFDKNNLTLKSERKILKFH